MGEGATVTPSEALPLFREACRDKRIAPGMFYNGFLCRYDPVGALGAAGPRRACAESAHDAFVGALRCLHRGEFYTAADFLTYVWGGAVLLSRGPCASPDAGRMKNGLTEPQRALLAEGAAHERGHVFLRRSSRVQCARRLAERGLLRGVEYRGCNDGFIAEITNAGREALRTSGGTDYPFPDPPHGFNNPRPHP